jgi:hypothetical protein
LCYIDVIDYLYSDDSETDEDEISTETGGELYLCRLQNSNYRSRAGYRIDIPADFIVAHEDVLATGAASVCISAGSIDPENYSVYVADGAELTIVEDRRKLNTRKMSGTRSVLAVQLTTSYMSDSFRQMEDSGVSTSQIEGSIFGTGPDSPGHSLVSQYKECSFGALNLEPARGPNIVDGVVEVQLNRPVAGGEILGSLQDDIIEAIEKRVGSVDLYDHLIICIPDNALMNSRPKWTAFTYFSSHWSIFQRGRCKALSVVAHELGAYEFLSWNRFGLGKGIAPSVLT